MTNREKRWLWVGARRAALAWRDDGLVHFQTSHIFLSELLGRNLHNSDLVDEGLRPALEGLAGPNGWTVYKMLLVRRIADER